MRSCHASRNFCDTRRQIVEVRRAGSSTAVRARRRHPAVALPQYPRYAPPPCNMQSGVVMATPMPVATMATRASGDVRTRMPWRRRPSMPRCRFDMLAGVGAGTVTHQSIALRHRTANLCRAPHRSRCAGRSAHMAPEETTIRSTPPRPSMGSRVSAASISWRVRARVWEKARPDHAVTVRARAPSASSLTMRAPMVPASRSTRPMRRSMLPGSSAAARASASSRSAARASSSARPATIRPT